MKWNNGKPFFVPFYFLFLTIQFLPIFCFLLSSPSFSPLSSNRRNRNSWLAQTLVLKNKTHRSLWSAADGVQSLDIYSLTGEKCFKHKTRDNDHAHINTHWRTAPCKCFSLQGGGCCPSPSRMDDVTEYLWIQWNTRNSHTSSSPYHRIHHHESSDDWTSVNIVSIRHCIFCHTVPLSRQ